MGSYLPWLLFASFLVLGFTGGFASVWAYFYFPSGEDLSLKPPLNRTEPTTQRWNNYRKVTQEFENYVDAKQKSSNYFEDSRLYVILPGGLNALASLVLVLAFSFSRKIFSYTVVIYTAFCLWAVNLLVTVVFQYTAAKVLQKNQDFKKDFLVIVGIHTGQLILLLMQVVMAGIEVRRQKVAWPTINIKNILTFNTPLLTLRVLLSNGAIITFYESAIRRGLYNRMLDEDFDIWKNPRERFPDYYLFPCVVILMYGATVNFEASFSLFLGKVHTKLMGVTSLISGIMYCFVAVISSPSVMFLITGYEFDYKIVPLMVSSFGATLVFLLHGIICLSLPKKMESPLKIAEKLSAFVHRAMKNPGSIIKRDSPTSDGSFSTAREKITNLSGKAMLMILSVVALILAFIGIKNSQIGSWECIVITVGDAIILSRTLSSIFIELYTQKEETTVLKMFLHFVIEGNLTLIGAILCFTHMRAELILTGIVKLLGLVIMVRTTLLMPELKAAIANFGKDGLQNESSNSTDEDCQYVELQSTTEPENEDASLPPA